MDLLKNFAFLVAILLVLACNIFCTGNDNYDDDLEDEMELRLERAGQRVTLRLKKNDNVRDDVPVYISERNVVQKVDKSKMHRFKAYQDLENMASMLVADIKDESGKRSLKVRSYRGTFNIAGSPYVLRPVIRTLPPVRGTRGAGREIRTVDLGDVTEMSHEAKRAMQEMVDDSRINPKVRMSESLNEMKRNMKITKRQQQNQKTIFGVELAIFVDYAKYEKFLNEADGQSTAEKERNAEKNITFYYCHVANDISLRYNTIRETDFEINVKLVMIRIFKTRQDSNHTEDPSVTDTRNSRRETDADEALTSFEGWIKRTDLPNFDHATLFTGNKLYVKSPRKYLSGLADNKGVCGDLRASIAEDEGEFAAGVTAAHELGHNLGIVDHDGQGNANATDCTLNHQFVMADHREAVTDTTRNNPFQFSTCSITQLRNFLFELQRNQSLFCLWNNATNLNDIDTALTTEPGQEFTPHEQCQLSVGPSSYYCGEGKRDAEICNVLECYMPNKSRCDSHAALRAFDGTTCGEQRWCYKGQCVQNNRAPRILDNKHSCIYGDYQGKIISQGHAKCSELIRNKPHLCNDEFIRNLCCQTCGCFDEAHWCAKIDTQSHAEWCYGGDVGTKTCCHTCRKYLTGIPGCEYGDHVQGCTQASCTGNNHQCCNTCPVG